ncbi:MAG: GNAT family N-acetyltransferase [Allomuricauda sp.]|jgi:CelD/BcsL family acetyltransferase involved in cellulose biosynthesis
MYNRYLLDWKQYHELIYPMVLKKEASLFVIYANNEPISISLELYFEVLCFGYIHGYDSTYLRYQSGDIRMVKFLEWLIDHNFKIFDYMMGETMFKTKWSNHTYDYYSQQFLRKIPFPLGLN